MNSPTKWIILHPVWFLKAWSNIHVDEKSIYHDLSLGANSVFNINAESQKFFFFFFFLYTSNIFPRNVTSVFLKEDCFLFVCKFYQELSPVLESNVVDDSAAYSNESPIHIPPLVCIWNYYSHADFMNILLYFEFKIQNISIKKNTCNVWWIFSSLSYLWIYS